MKHSAFDDFSESAHDALDFARCQRADGSYYGTGGQCRKGTPVGPREIKAIAKKAKDGDAKAKKALEKMAADGDKDAKKALEEMGGDTKELGGTNEDVAKMKEEVDKMAKEGFSEEIEDMAYKMEEDGAMDSLNELVGSEDRQIETDMDDAISSVESVMERISEKRGEADDGVLDQLDSDAMGVESRMNDWASGQFMGSNREGMSESAMAVLRDGENMLQEPAEQEAWINLGKATAASKGIALKDDAAALEMGMLVYGNVVGDYEMKNNQGPPNNDRRNYVPNMSRSNRDDWRLNNPFYTAWTERGETQSGDEVLQSIESALDEL